MKRGQTINKDRYCATLTRLREAIRRKWPGMLSEGGKSGVTPYSPDLAPSDCFLFPRMKEHLSGRRFSSDSAVKTSAETWFNGRGPDFYQDGLSRPSSFHTLPKLIWCGSWGCNLGKSLSNHEPQCFLSAKDPDSEPVREAIQSGD
ncbi:hypothetical protein TNCV_4933591 [Trichonephila clavipes]|nr:hypothetical protein TNCV_4933591 [Trichonephila clavipes]